MVAHWTLGLLRELADDRCKVSAVRLTAKGGGKSGINRVVKVDIEYLWYHTCGWIDLAGPVDRGHKLFRYDPRVKTIVLVVSLTSKEENVLEEGRMEEVSGSEFAATVM